MKLQLSKGASGILFGISLALIAALTACGGGSSSTSGPAEQNAGESLPTGDNVLRLAGGDPISLDPALAADATSAEYIVEIFSGLVSLDRDLKIAPDIAKSWDVSPDGKVYTFHLREDALFHNLSRRVTADDFKYSLERSLDPKTQSTTGLLYLADIVGAREFAKGQADGVSGIRVIDPNTLEIAIDAPKPYFLAKLTYPTAMVVDRNQVEGNARGWWRRPNGTGPFKLREFRLGERIVLDAFDRYHQGRPKLDQVVYFLSGGSAMTMYENGELDLTGVGLNDIERVRDTRDPLNRDYVQADQLDVWYIGLNSAKPPFDDLKVRQAFAHAIDKDRLVEVVLLDAWKKAEGILPPGMPGYSPDLKGLQFDVERARQLLRESKYGGPDGLPAIVMTTSGQGATPGVLTEAVVAMWEQNLGVNVEVQQSETSTFFQQLNRGDVQMFEAGWIADYVDPEDFLDIKLHSASSDNDSKYRNPEVDRLLEQARTENNAEKRLDLYRQAERIIVSEAPWIPLYHTRANVLIKPYVKDYTVPPLVIPHLRFVSIER